MAEETEQTLRYRVLRYMPNLVRDEWVNIGVLLEETTPERPRREARFIDEDAALKRLRRLHPEIDEDALRALSGEFGARLQDPEAALQLEKMDQTLSNVLQFSPYRAVLAGDFDAELDRLFRVQVAPPAPKRVGMAEGTREWIRARLRDVFYRHRVLARLERSIPAEPFTQPGDPLRIDYGYRYNGTRGFLQPVALNSDPGRAKIFAYTAEQIRRHLAKAEFTAITDVEPSPENRRHQFVARVLGAQEIAILPLNRVEKFADELRARLQ